MRLWSDEKTWCDFNTICFRSYFVFLCFWILRIVLKFVFVLGIYIAFVFIVVCFVFNSIVGSLPQSGADVLEMLFGVTRAERWSWQRDPCVCLKRPSTHSSIHPPKNRTVAIYCSSSPSSCLILEKSNVSPVPRLKMFRTSRQVVSKCVVASYDSEIKICESSPSSTGSK